MLKKYSSLIIFAVIEIIITLISFSYLIKNNSTLLSASTALFLVVTPLLYYVLTRKKQTEFTFWFVLYSVFKITPYVFKMEGNFFEGLFQLKIYFNIAFLIYLIWKAFQFIKNFRKTLKQKNNIEQDDYSIISNSLQEAIKFKKLAKMISFEVCSFYYCFIKWSRNNNDNNTGNSFSGYKESGMSAVYIGLMLVSVFEAVGLHFLLISWNKTVSLLLLVLHVYILINLIGHLKAVFFRSHLVLSQKIIIRYGLFDTLEIPFDLLHSIQKFEGDYEKSSELVKFALLGKLEPHNIAIELRDKIFVSLPFGITKQPSRILLYIDNAKDFLKVIKDKIEEDNRQTVSLQLEKSM
ncbi:hypothetical protein NJT12_22065 [Flavobacterium sp. AC]|uniref:Beta-carotene 15,15'-monooxygenase n=1 Tax=Flavobacterium azizsancarii TaxID=2961580 RepID=A0ABT4WI95_9FLAO|nr:hypothetical protein [Flavobacterium azizsancarii]MDA6072318.1 hypothetical protein [Flavobacterium azizsancarii]